MPALDTPDADTSFCRFDTSRPVATRSWKGHRNLRAVPRETPPATHRHIAWIHAATGFPADAEQCLDTRPDAV